MHYVRQKLLFEGNIVPPAFSNVSRSKGRLLSGALLLYFLFAAGWLTHLEATSAILSYALT